METTESLTRYRSRLNLIGVLGMPFYAAFALGSAAHFKGNAIISVLENPEIAFYTFVVGAVGAAIDLVLALYTTYKIKGLEDAIT